MRIRISKKLEYGKLVTPLPDRHVPVYRWFQMKESFSGALVKMLLDLWGSPDKPLLDPFCGAGTTLLACKEMGVNGIGLETHPFLLFVSRAKTWNYDVPSLETYLSKVLASPTKRTSGGVPPLVKRVFPLSIQREILAMKEPINAIPNEKIRDFLKMALLRTAVRCSWMRKDGAVIKTAARKIPDFRHALECLVEEMVRDLMNFPQNESAIQLIRADARHIPLKDNSVGGVITSPPYLFKSEYLREFVVEEWVAEVEHASTPSVIHTEDVEKYFSDMERVLSELYRVCVPGAKLCFVVSDGGTRKGVVEVGPTLCEVAHNIGFKAKKMVIVNERWCTTPSRKKVGILRESLLFWEKPA